MRSGLNVVVAVTWEEAEGGEAEAAAATTPARRRRSTVLRPGVPRASGAARAVSQNLRYFRYRYWYGAGKYGTVGG